MDQSHVCAAGPVPLGWHSKGASARKRGMHHASGRSIPELSHRPRAGSSWETCLFWCCSLYHPREASDQSRYPTLRLKLSPQARQRLRRFLESWHLNRSAAESGADGAAVHIAWVAEVHTSWARYIAYSAMSVYVCKIAFDTIPCRP